MPALLTDKYRTFLAKQFLQGIASELTAVYVFVGRSSEWFDAANVSVSDTNPPVPVDDPQNVDFDFWRDLIAAKRVTDASSRFVVPRRDWVSGTLYAQYDDLDDSLASKEYYVLDTFDLPFKVYKCVWNNLGAASTVAPSTIGASLVPQETADGYVWQYMYAIDTDTASRYLTNLWMPVLADSSVQTNALNTPGKLPTAVPLVIVSGGAGYSPLDNTVITIEGDGSGANAVSAGVSISGGAISEILLVSGGLGYTEVTDINVFQVSATTAANVRAIIPPYPNHGFDPLKELSTAALMLTVQFNADESGELTTINDYRRIGILVNPTKVADANVANASFYRQTTDITISANTGVLLPDDVVTNISKTSRPFGTVVDVVTVANNYVVRVTSVDDEGEATPFQVGETIKNLDSGVEATIASVEGPELTPYSGDIIWVNHRTPVSRGPTQIEEIKIIFPFR